MAVRRMIIIIRAVQISRHNGNIICSVLTVQEFTVFETGDLSQGIRFIGLLQFTCQKAALFHRLRCHAGINAGASEKFELFASVFPCAVNDIHLHDHIYVHKIGKGFRIRCDAAYLGCSQEHILRLFLCEEFFDIFLTAQVQFSVCAGHYVGVSLSHKLPYNCRSDHASVPGYIYFRVFFHSRSFRRPLLFSCRYIPSELFLSSRALCHAPP